MHQTTQDANFLDTKQAAQILGRSHRTLETWRRTGRGPAYIQVKNRRTLYSLENLQTFMAASKKEGRKNV